MKHKPLFSEVWFSDHPLLQPYLLRLVNTKANIVLYIGQGLCMIRIWNRENNFELCNSVSAALHDLNHKIKRALLSGVDLNWIGRIFTALEVPD